MEELHAFFKTRGVTFGSAEDLKPFVERLDSDAGFREEIASMMRAIIYRERDGLSWPELVELLTAAVGGEHVENAESPEVREAVRRLMAFVESVFRTRRNPGAAAPNAAAAEAKPGEAGVAETEVAAEPTAKAAPAEDAKDAPAAHPPMDVFYRARMAAQEEEEAGSAPELRTEADAIETETVVLHREEHWHIPGHVPLEDFEGRETTERGSPVWLWVAGICALLLAFSAGLFVRQRFIVPLRDPSQPYEAPPAQAANQGSQAVTGTAANHAQPPAPASVQSAPEAGLTAGGVAKPSAAAAPDSLVRPRYLAPATIGASAALMESRLVYAPPPSYPMVAEMTRIQGKVIVEAVVGKNGRVIRAKAIGGHRLLRGAAVREVYQRRYRPYMLDDRARDVATIVTVDFRLKK